MIQLKDIRKSFGETRAVNGVSLEARPGEVFGIIGPNGAGKSTTIRILMNIYTPDSGQVLFSGRSLRETDKERIGYLPEERGLYPKVAVGHLLSYLVSLKGRDPVKWQHRIDHWLDRFGLLENKRSKTETLSRGMGQKVQFIGAVAHDPDIVILDEPFSGLDPVSVDVLREAILDLRRDGRVVLFSTHVMEQAERICDRLLLIDKGEGVLHGSLQEIRQRFGANTVQIEYDGDAAVVRRHPAVAEVVEYPRYLESVLNEGADTNGLLRDLLEHATIHRFERVTPSLHKIFVDTVRGDEPKRNEGRT